jgi:hypothetical protein
VLTEQEKQDAATLTRQLQELLRDLEQQNELRKPIVLPQERVNYVVAMLPPQGDDEDADAPASDFGALKQVARVVERQRDLQRPAVALAEAKLASTKPLLTALDALAAREPRKLKDTEDWPRFQQQVREYALDKGIADDLVDRVLLESSEVTLAESLRLAQAHVQGRWRFLRDYRQLIIASMVGAKIALLAAALGGVRLGSATGDYAGAHGLAEAVQDEAWELERALVLALRGGARARINRASLDLQEHIDTRVKALSDYEEALRRVVKEERSAAYYDAVLVLGEAARTCLRTYALGITAESVLVRHGVHPDLAEWSENAKSLPLRRPRFPKGIRPPLDLNQPARGAGITIRGKIIHSSINTLAGRTASGRTKRVQLIQVMNPDTQAVTPVCLPYYNIHATGVSEVMRVTGKWVPDTLRAHLKVKPETADQFREYARPGLDVTRISLRDLATSSWWHWATLQLRPVYDHLPNSLSVWGGISPEMPAALLTYGTWATRVRRWGGASVEL